MARALVEESQSSGAPEIQGSGAVMAYAQIESSVRTNSKFLRAGDAACWLWICGILYSQDTLTDGFIPDEVLHLLGPKQPATLAKRLEHAGLWERSEGGWKIHDYLEHNKSAAEIKALRKVRAEGGKLGGRPPDKPSRRTLKDNLQGLPLEDPKTETLEGNPSSTSSTATTSTDSVGRQNGDPPTPHPIRDLLALHEELFVQRTGLKPTSYSGKDAKAAERVLQRYSFADACTLLRLFMSSSDTFIAHAGFGFNVFQSQINKLISERSATETPAPRTSDIARYVNRKWGRA